MGEEVAKQPTYEERRLAAKEHAAKVMGDATAENFMAAAQDHTLADEYRDLVEWYTDAYDAAMIDTYHDDPAAPTAALQSIVRRKVRETQPQKFDRLRELERVMERQHKTNQNMSSAAFATITAQKLESEWVA